MDWYDLRDPSDPRLDELAARYKLHPLHIEDCRHRNQSAKIEPQGDYIFIVLKAVELNEDGELTTGDLDLFVGPNYVIAVEESACGSVRQVLDRVTNGSVLRPDQFFYRILDGVIDSYNPVLDALSDRIDKIEDEVLTCPEPQLLEQLFDIRSALIQMRRIMANSRDVAGHLLRNEYPLIRPDLGPFFRDVYDHITRNLDTIEVERDLATGAMELYLSSVANQTNQVMKVLTVFGAVATPALVITGIYGMNLRHLPFADHPYSWGIVLGLIACVSIVMLFIFRKLRWL